MSYLENKRNEVIENQLVKAYENIYYLIDRPHAADSTRKTKIKSSIVALNKALKELE